MTDAFRSLIMAFSMFSVIPMPRIQWKEENMRYMLAWLPAVGVAAGVLQWGWLLLCNFLSFGPLLFAAGMTLFPILLTGGIHIDGFSDTVDALSSHAEPMRKREILKDPNAGAFAVLYTAGYLLLFAALCTELPRTLTTALTLGLHQTAARALGALCSVCFPSASQSGLQYTFRDAASKKVTAYLAVWTVLCMGVLCLLSLPGGIACAAVFLLLFLYLKRVSRRQFGGMSGDLAGYIITLAGLFMLFSYLITERIAAL